MLQLNRPSERRGLSQWVRFADWNEVARTINGNVTKINKIASWNNHTPSNNNYFSLFIQVSLRNQHTLWIFGNAPSLRHILAIATEFNCCRVPSKDMLGHNAFWSKYLENAKGIGYLQKRASEWCASNRYSGIKKQRDPVTVFMKILRNVFKYCPSLQRNLLTLFRDLSHTSALFHNE